MIENAFARSTGVVIARRTLPLLLAGAALASCGGEERKVDANGPHPPASAQERLLAGRYHDFAGALERRDADGICQGLAPRLARSYRCSAPGAPRLPAQLRGIAVSNGEIYAATDPAVPDEIQISAPTTRGDGSLIVFFRQDGDAWRIKRAIVGGYG